MWILFLPGSVDHYKVYGLQPQAVAIPDVALEDQFGLTIVDLVGLGKLGGEGETFPGGILIPNAGFLRNRLRHEHISSYLVASNGHDPVVIFFFPLVVRVPFSNPGLDPMKTLKTS